MKNSNQSGSLTSAFSGISWILVIFLLTHSCSPKPEFFESALPIWSEGRETEKNLSLVFKTQFHCDPNDEVTLRITGSSLYRILLNGEFAGHGPARAGHGYYRVDKWELSDFIQSGKNDLSIEVASYNVNSFYLLDQPGFLQAELVANAKVIKATGKNEDFLVFENTERVQKVPRYSFQRPFIEYYQIRPKPGPGKDRGTQDPSLPLAKTRGPKSDKRCKTQIVGEKKLLPRRIAYPDFEIVRPETVVSKGMVETGIEQEYYWRDRAVTNIGPKLGGFPEDELEYNPAIELQEMYFEKSGRAPRWLGSIGPVNESLDSCQYIIFDFKTNLSGFIGLKLRVQKPTRIFAIFDEILQNGDVNFKRLGTIAAVTYDLHCHHALDAGPDGTGRILSLESFEPYTFRYLKLIVPKGSVTIEDVYLREYANPEVDQATFHSSDERLNRIYQAGVETFRQNAVDIFMDCPHRERAGWLCDSYFTARVAQDLSGHATIEKNFYENFLLPDSFPHLPEGMLPMCYPADHNDSVFIPNWAMWFVVELEEYLNRSHDREMVDELEPRVMALIDYFRPFQNEDGLLEKLESWIFIEWSAANRFVQDVNYPSNMLFAKMLETAGKLYSKPALIREAENIRQVIRKQSFNGTFFVDNAIRQEDKTLTITENTTEVCQYFAFFFDIASPEECPELWRKLSEEFGPDRQESGLFPDVHPANAFVGNYIRLELLSRYGLQAQLLDESIDYFDYMAKETGTLWENIGTYASCNHGFASHVVHLLYRDILGINSVNQKLSVISFQFSALPLERCEGQIPIGDELLKVGWETKGDELHVSYSLPDGFTVTIENNSNLKLIVEK